MIFNGVCSTEWNVKNGARQGGILSPYLFCFYINDMLEIICIYHFKTNIIPFADDIVEMAQ